MMSAIDWAKFCAGMQWDDVRVDSEGRVTQTAVDVDQQAHAIRFCTCYLPRDKQLCQHKNECVEVQAHAMSHPSVQEPEVWPMDKWTDGFDDAPAVSTSSGVQHVSDAAYEAFHAKHLTVRSVLEHNVAEAGTVLRTVAEWQEIELRERTYHDAASKALAERDDLRAQLAAKTAECERLHRDLRNADAALADMDERLREGREDDLRTNVKGQAAGLVVSTNELAQQAKSSACAAIHAARAAYQAENLRTLDPRLGVQQPEGEPGEPMPYWRRSGV